jgi:glycosyltransferase involved in cell wall biosynthesis
MNILFISHSSQWGGAEKILYQLLKLLAKDEFNCSCIFPKPGPLEIAVKNLNVKTFVSEIKWWVGGKENRFHTLLNFCEGIKERINKIAEIITSNKIDLVITNTIVMGEGAIAAKLMNIPHVWHIHEILSNDPGLHGPLELQQFYSLVLRMTDFIVTVSKAVQEEIENFLGYSSQKIGVIYNGIEIDKGSLEIEKNLTSPIVAAAGNIYRRKGFDTLLRAAKRVCEQIPNTKFIIAGRVTEQDYYEKLLAERKIFGLENNFEFVDFQNDIYSFYKHASVFVLPSVCEPMGLVLLEAMSACVPVIATECGGPSEIIVDGQSGFLVPVNDEKGMAEKIIYLINNRDVAVRMGRAAYERVKNNFNVKDFIDNYSKLLTGITSGREKEKKTSHAELEMLLDIFDLIGIEKTKIVSAVEFYEMVKRSLPAKLYQRLGPMKKVARKLAGFY